MAFDNKTLPTSSPSSWLSRVTKHPVLHDTARSKSRTNHTRALNKRVEVLREQSSRLHSPRVVCPSFQVFGYAGNRVVLQRIKDAEALNSHWQHSSASRSQKKARPHSGRRSIISLKVEAKASFNKVFCQLLDCLKIQLSKQSVEGKEKVLFSNSTFKDISNKMSRYAQALSFHHYWTQKNAIHRK